MELLIIMGFYTLGLITGAIGMITLTIYVGKRALAKEKTKIGLTAVPSKPKQTVNERMKRIKDITDEQLEMMQSIDGPQKNGLDGKYKNGINSQIKLLDEEKNELLCSILEDGHDPEITTMDGSGIVSRMLLSEYMAYMGIKMAPKKTIETPKTERIGKFTVVKGGKDDGGNTTH